MSIALNLYMVLNNLNNNNSSDPWAWDVFPLVCIFFNSFSKETFHCIHFSHTWLNFFLSILLFLMLLWMGYFLYFIFRCFIISLKECNLFLYVDFVSCHFMKIINSNSFLTDSLGFPIYKIITSANSNSFTSSFLIWMHFLCLA